VYYYHFDGLGSVVALSDVNSVLVERYTYDVFGRPTIRDANGVVIAESAFANPYLFTGRAYDAESGLYYYRARYYDYYTGRFLQPDPAGYTDGLNLYAYVGNNPLAYVDPFGLCEATTTQIPGLHSAEEVEGLMAVVALGMHANRLTSGSVGQYVQGFVLHSCYGALDLQMHRPYDLYTVPGVQGSGPNGTLTASEFGNYMAGFSGGLIGVDGYIAVRMGGHAIAGIGQGVDWIQNVTPPETITDAPSRVFIDAGSAAASGYRLPWEMELVLRFAGK